MPYFSGASKETPTEDTTDALIDAHFALRTHPELKDLLPKEYQNLLKETEKGINNLNYYKGFQQQAEKIKSDILQFLLEKKKSGKKVVAYGAAAKGNTLLNYCGVKNDLIDYVVDLSPYKQNKFLPGSHIPVVDENKIKRTKPDYVLILPWNLKEEIIQQLAYIKEWDGKFVTGIPKLEVI